MLRELMPHQERALSYLRENDGGALFMQMRLGKTLVVIRYAQKQRFQRILVVAPLEGIWAWKRELGMEEEKFLVLHGIKPDARLSMARTRFFVRCWFLVNYETLLSTPELLNEDWELVVLDESRRIANPQAKITKLVNKTPYHRTRRVVLSGEPAPESPLEYFEQYKFVHGTFLMCNNYWEFRNRYFRELAPHEFVPRPDKLDRLKAEIRECGFFLSRKEAGIPDKKVYETRTVELPPVLRIMYNGVLKDFVASMDGKILKDTKWVPVQYLWLNQIASGWLGEKFLWKGKQQLLIDLFQGELKKEQVVVWFRFNPALRYIYKQLKALGISVAKITGEESREEREAAINDFRAGRLRGLLCQIKCGKTAIDLSTSSTAIYFTNSYSLEERKQSEDRILNPKKREPLLYLDLVTEGTVEEDILEALRQKNADARFFTSRLINSLRKEVLV